MATRKTQTPAALHRCATLLCTDPDTCTFNAHTFEKPEIARHVLRVDANTVCRQTDRQTDLAGPGNNKKPAVVR
ncbi:uncharacterized protein V6R79_006912 [Siganus canaliculatus]